MKRLLAAILVSMFGHVAIADIQEPCFPSVNLQARAKCAFDIWGFVVDRNGIPVNGARVIGSQFVATTDSSGFYDLFEHQPERYSVEADHPTNASCWQSVFVNDQALPAIENGGTRQDFKLPCDA